MPGTSVAVAASAFDGAAPSADAAIAAFRRAAARVPAYRTLLDEHGVNASAVVDAASYARLVPVLTKASTFARFSIDQLSVDGVLPPLADVLTSSGHGGRFSFGITTREQAERTTEMVDTALDDAFGVRSRSTLAINCLPMGVVFSSRCMTVATTSVREDMATALVRTFGDRYDQVVLVSDPLFLKRLLDHARESGLDWSRYRVNVVIGEETFGEHFRRYVAHQLGLSPGDPASGRILSSFGVGELGLHLCFETAETVALRRALAAHPAFARELLGTPSAMALPMMFAYNPRRTFIEIENPQADGFGRMTVSMLDPELPLPLLRYQTGDVACLMDPAAVLACARRHDLRLPDVPAALIAVRGRASEALPTGSHVATYKDALYADPEVAHRLSGAVRLACDETGCTMHVQLGSGVERVDGVADRLLEVIPAASRPSRVVVWPHGRFPFGMRLDYERKFTHFVPTARGAASGS